MYSTLRRQTFVETGRKLLSNALFTNVVGRSFPRVVGGKTRGFLDGVIGVHGEQVGERIRFLVAILWQKLILYHHERATL